MDPSSDDVQVSEWVSKKDLNEFEMKWKWICIQSTVRSILFMVEYIFQIMSLRLD